VLRQLEAQATETCSTLPSAICKDEDAQWQTKDGFDGGPPSMPVHPRASRLPNLASRGSLRGPERGSDPVLRLPYAMYCTHSIISYRIDTADMYTLLQTAVLVWVTSPLGHHHWTANPLQQSYSCNSPQYTSGPEVLEKTPKSWICSRMEKSHQRSSYT
jgi:hypothetical protein